MWKIRKITIFLIFAKSGFPENPDFQISGKSENPDFFEISKNFEKIAKIAKIVIFVIFSKKWSKKGSFSTIFEKCDRSEPSAIYNAAQDSCAVYIPV